MLQSRQSPPVDRIGRQASSLSPSSLIIASSDLLTSSGRCLRTAWSTLLAQLSVRTAPTPMALTRNRNCQLHPLHPKLRVLKSL